MGKRNYLNIEKEYFFVDIDGTITDTNPEKKYPESKLVWRNSILGVIRDVMIEEGWNGEDAKRKLEEYADEVIWWDYPDFIAEFNLPVEETWKRIYEWHENYLIVYEDTVDLIKELKKMNKNLYIVSNNPIVGCLLKLKRAGLGDITGTSYFKRILGANILRGQKWQIQLWKKAIAQIGVETEKIAIIGDNEEEDGNIPLSVGIGISFVLKRDIEENFYKEGKKIYFKNAKVLLEFLKNQS